MIRLQDLQSYQPQLQSYKESSASFEDWIEATKKNQEALQATKINSIQTLMDHINQQKVSYSSMLLFEVVLCICSGLRDLMCVCVCLCLCHEGPELRNQIKEGDPGQCAEGQRGLWDFYQSEDAIILSQATNGAFT